MNQKSIVFLGADLSDTDQVGVFVPDLQRLMAFASYGVPGTWNTPGDVKGIPGGESWVGKPDFSFIVVWNIL